MKIICMVSHTPMTTPVTGASEVEFGIRIFANLSLSPVNLTGFWGLIPTRFGETRSASIQEGDRNPALPLIAVSLTKQ